jgi:hypothetical protein
MKIFSEEKMHKKKFGLFGSLVVLASLMFGQIVFAQTPVAIWIHISDNYWKYDSITMWFGNHVNATYEKPDTLYIPGINPWSDTIREHLAPPYEGFHADWVNIPGRINTWDMGLMVYDFRPFPTDEARKDTFRIKFSSDSSGADITFRWPKVEYLDNVCDSIKCIPSGGSLINMFDIDSLVIPRAGESGIIYLRIYKWGKVTTEVNTGKTLFPTDVRLYQNYPNPFNPVTKINYTLAEGGFVSLKVFNLLGQEVGKLVDGYQTAGGKSVGFNAYDLPTGVYFYRLVTGDNVEMKRMALIK